MASACIISLEFIIDLRRSLEFLLQAVGAHQRRGTVHLIEVKDLLRDFNIGVVVVQFLLHKFIAEYRAKLLSRHGF